MIVKTDNVSKYIEQLNSGVRHLELNRYYSENLKSNKNIMSLNLNLKKLVGKQSLIFQNYINI